MKESGPLCGPLSFVLSPSFLQVELGQGLKATQGHDKDRSNSAQTGLIVNEDRACDRCLH